MRPSYSIYNCGKWKTDVQLYNTKDHPIVLKKGTTVARMVAANEVPEMVVAEGTVGALQTHQWAKEGHVRLSVEDWRKLSPWACWDSSSVNACPLGYAMLPPHFNG